MAAAMNAQFGVPADTRGVHFSGRTDKGIVADLFREHGIEATAEAEAGFHQQYLQRLPGELQKRPGSVLPGVVAWLDLIRDSAHCEMGLLTGNMQAAAHIKLQHFGLMDYFCCGGFGDHHANRDLVAADAIDAVQQLIGSTAHTKTISDKSLSSPTVWVVGDTPRDVTCAHANGAKAIAVATGDYSQEMLAECNPDVLLNDLSSLDPLRSLLSNSAK